jgi:hypothetical protein
MKVLFAGPSLSGADPDLTGIDLRPPAAHGDLALAVLQGATAIGLVDGLFDAVAAVWHKEILFALSRGVRVLGASSMGALRVAECAAFGMLPVGETALSYLDGRRDDDADVALAHGPAELGYVPLTEPIVDVEATLANLAGLGLLQPSEHRAILARARSIFFTERTVAAMLPPGLAALYETYRVHLKQRDALLLVDRLRQLPDGLDTPPSWTMNQSPMWLRRLAALSAPDVVTSA